MAAVNAEYEADFLKTLVPKLESEGYSVFIYPSRDMLPPFLGTYRPDAIAIRKDEKMAIEVVTGKPGAEERLLPLRNLFSSHPEWSFRVFYAPPLIQKEEFSALPKELMVQHLDRIEKGIEIMGPQGVILGAWSVFEAVARSIISTDKALSRPPGQIVEALAAEGYITPDEAHDLREISALRNKIAHGQLGIVPSRESQMDLIKKTRMLLDFYQAPATNVLAE